MEELANLYTRRREPGQQVFAQWIEITEF